VVDYQRVFLGKFSKSLFISGSQFGFRTQIRTKVAVLSLRHVLRIFQICNGNSGRGGSILEIATKTITKKIPNPIDRHVGSRVRMRRVLVGMSQEKLGEALALTFQQVQKYEKGTNRIGASRLQQISRILGVPVEYFFEGAPQANDRVASNGFGEVSDTTYVADFLATNEGVQLNKAFVRIKDPKLRRKVVELVSAMAGEDLAA